MGGLLKSHELNVSLSPPSLPPSLSPLPSPLSSPSPLPLLPPSPPSLPSANQEGGSPILVGLATYDKVLHFYNLNPSLAQPGMMVVADTSDVFVPMVDGFLVNVREAHGVMER